MHIVHVCATSIPVPPVGYGGTERLVFWIAREQQKLGLRVTVIAHPDSRIAELLPGVTLVPCDRSAPVSDAIPRDADVLHLHRMPADEREPTLPYLITEHGLRKPGAQYLRNTVFVSRAHAQLHGSEVFVANGVPVEDYRYETEKQRYLLFMARMEWPRKNARCALDLAVDAGVPLHITGERSPWLTRKVWGQWMLRPVAARRLVRSEPYVDGEPKKKLLAEAGALFHAVNWHEPFSLVAHEALASGTPVIASPNGALAEFIVDGVNGALVTRYAEALQALRRIVDLGDTQRRELSARCRASAATASACAAGYVALYEKVMGGAFLADTQKPMARAAAAPLLIHRPWRLA